MEKLEETGECESRLSMNTVKNDPNSDDDEQLNGEHVFHDVMDSICQHLKIYELSKVAQVCKSWKGEALREIDKRHHECKVFPFLYSPEIRHPSFHVSKILDTMPYVTILFPGTDYNLSDVRNDVELEYDIYNVYREQFPNTLIVVGMSVSMVNDKKIHSCPLQMSNGTAQDRYSPAGILGLCLPMNKRLKIQQAFLLESELHGKQFPEIMEFCEKKFESMICNLKSKSSNSKSALILFASNLNEFSSAFILDIIKKNYVEGSYTLWGFTTFYRKVFASNNAEEMDSNGEHEIRYFVLNINGPNLESWSSVISIRVSTEELENKLREFRNQMHLKQYSMGFLCAPMIFYDDTDQPVFDETELAEIVKNVFPRVTFISVFGTQEDCYFGINSINDNNEPTTIENIISIMVITYD